jgi:hypothetical protein
MIWRYAERECCATQCTELLAEGPSPGRASHRIRKFPCLNCNSNRYRRLALKYHPDCNKDEDSKEEFARVCESYDVLSDREWRVPVY